MHRNVSLVKQEFLDWKGVCQEGELLSVHPSKIEVLLRNIEHYEKVLTDIHVNCDSAVFQQVAKNGLKGTA